jgi:hypothetical protein
MSGAARIAATATSLTTLVVTSIAQSVRGRGTKDRLAAREADRLPVSHFHVVFTLLAETAPIASQNKVYDLLLRTAAETLLTVAADPKHESRPAVWLHPNKTQPCPIRASLRPSR